MARLKKSNKVGEIIFDIKNYCITKLGQCGICRGIGKWISGTGAEKLEMNPHKYAQLKLLTKGTKMI